MDRSAISLSQSNYRLIIWDLIICVNLNKWFTLRKGLFLS